MARGTGLETALSERWRNLPSKARTCQKISSGVKERRDCPKRPLASGMLLSGLRRQQPEEQPKSDRNAYFIGDRAEPGGAL